MVPQWLYLAGTTVHALYWDSFSANVSFRGGVAL
jgi:hypothetical protein